MEGAVKEGRVRETYKAVVHQGLISWSRCDEGVWLNLYLDPGSLIRDD